MKKQSVKTSVVKEAGQVYKASEARQNFFSILESVAAGNLSAPVIVRHKDLADDIALVNARELKESQALLKALLAHPRNGKKFKLFGSGTLHGDVEEFLKEMRAERKAAMIRRLDTL